MSASGACSACVSRSVIAAAVAWLAYIWRIKAATFAAPADEQLRSAGSPRPASHALAGVHSRPHRSDDLCRAWRADYGRTLPSFTSIIAGVEPGLSKRDWSARDIGDKKVTARVPSRGRLPRSATRPLFLAQPMACAANRSSLQNCFGCIRWLQQPTPDRCRRACRIPMG
jgi:hypothetical protein